MLEHEPDRSRAADLGSSSLPLRPSWEAFNRLLGAQSLSNRYLAIRHGKSEANAAGIHSGDPAIGATRYPLTAEGAEGVRSSIEQAIRDGKLSGDVVIVSSGYLRARQTAEIVATALGGISIEIEPALGERGAGIYEGRASTLQEKREILRRGKEMDTLDPFHTTDGFESLVSVLERASGAILEIERRYSGKLVLLVSHHDAIQVMRTAFAKTHPAEMWQLSGVKNGQIVELELRVEGA